MEQSDWESRWNEGRTAFHQAEVTNLLDKYAVRVWGPEKVGRLYVPLCGKSLDLVYLTQKASTVVGVEFVKQAVDEFFTERGLTPVVEEKRHSGGPYTLFVADFFTINKEHVGSLDGVFDRAALVALDRDARVRYARHLSALLPAGSKSLLITFDYDQTEMHGPPFAVSQNEVNTLFADGFEVTHLETRDVLNDMFRSRGLTAMTESAFALTRLHDSR